MCTTELGTVAKLKAEFDQRNCKAIGVSVDGVESHKKWIRDIEETQGVRLNFPILGDGDRKVSKLFDMSHPEWNDTLTVRSVFVIDPNKKIRLIITYPASTGRNFQEILRGTDSLQLTDKHSVATPADWRQGEDVIIAPSLGGSLVVGDARCDWRPRRGSPRRTFAFYFVPSLPASTRSFRFATMRYCVRLRSRTKSA